MDRHGALPGKGSASPCRVLSCPAVSCRVLSCPVVSYRQLLSPGGSRSLCRAVQPGMAPEKFPVLPPGFPHCPEQSPGLCPLQPRAAAPAGQGLSPGVPFPDLPSEVADGREGAKARQEHWKRAQHIPTVTPGASPTPRGLFPAWDTGGSLLSLSQPPPASGFHSHHMEFLPGAFPGAHSPTGIIQSQGLGAGRCQHSVQNG